VLHGAVPSRLPPPMHSLLAALLVVVAASAPRAQETEVPVTALPFLGLPAVAEAGGATVGRTTDDPRAALQNPAVAALAARDAAVATGGAPVDAWFGESRYGVAASAWHLRRGALAASVVASAGTMRGADRTLGDGTVYAPADRFRGLSLAVGTTGDVRVAAGVTGRYVTSTDVPVWTGDAYETGAKRGATFDGGVAASANVAALAGRPMVAGLRPALDVTAGYAQTNVSGGIRYAGFGTQALPRLGALGWSATAGVDLPTRAGTLRLVEAEVARSAERLLVEEQGVTTRYAALIGGMPVGAPLAGAGDARTVGRAGLRLAVAETIAFSWGRFEGWGYAPSRITGWEVRTAGAARAVAGLTSSPVLDALARTDLRVGRTTVWAGTENAETRTTLTLVIGR